MHRIQAKAPRGDALGAARGRIDDIPRGLTVLLTMSWKRVDVEAMVVAGRAARRVAAFTRDHVVGRALLHRADAADWADA